MKAILRNLSRQAGHPSNAWLTLLLLLVVLAPSVCLLWFMHRAVQNERLAVRQKLVNAYRGHLSLAQERAENHWRQTAREMAALAASLPAAECFATSVQRGLAEAAVVFDAAGKVAYPNLVAPPPWQDTGEEWAAAERREARNLADAARLYARLAERNTNINLAARALLAQARCLIQAGDTKPAIMILVDSLAAAKYQPAVDSQGRLLVPNAELMALELTQGTDPQLARSLLGRLRRRLLDYGDASLASAQRRFLMREVQRLFPAQAQFPTLAAEDEAVRYLESGGIAKREAALGLTALPGVWQLSADGGRVVLLYRTENLVTRIRQVVASPSLPVDVGVEVLAPGQETDGALLSLTAGASMPGWRLSLVLQDQQLFEAATQERITWDIWIGILVVGGVAVLAWLALRLVHREVALTRLKNDLVANVTHELKTPLASMRLLVDTLLNTDRFHEQTAREYLQLIAKENVRLSRLIDNFLTFSRIERNKYAFDFKEVPAERIIEAATAAVRERFNTPGCHFERQVPPDLPSMVADADAIVTALLNLLENAFKYSGDQKQIQLSAGVRNGSVMFSVKDNGIGLSSRDLKHIFRRFYQVDQHLNRAGGGCGLGLSIVDFIVTAHHGTVDVKSQAGSGSIFTITIPLAGPGSPPETTT